MARLEERTYICLICGHEHPVGKLSRRRLGDGKHHLVCDDCRRDVLGEAECKQRA